ncbi:MAG: pilus assembly protein PilM [Deltaproteobacteria bacterium]|nr:pilus assembly protein PilM [Deltaproteobacteria bacterium]
MAISKKKTLVGLDIGSHCIKLVEIVHSKRGRVLQNFGVIHTPPGAVVEGSIKDQEGVASAIKTLYRNLRVRNSNVAVSLPGYSVISKKISLVKMEEAKVESAIQEEAEKYIPYDINEVNLDFAVLDTGGTSDATGEENETSKDSRQMEVLLVAAKREVIDEYVQLIQAADLNPGVLDADLFALQNAAEISLLNPEPCYAIINLGAAELEINVVTRGISTFSRDSSYGGAQVTDAIKAEFNIDLLEAEKMKLGGAELDDQKEEGLAKIVNHEVSGWIKEIKRALDFVSGTRAGDPIKKIIVSGGSCKTPGLQKYLELETGIPVEPLNPFRNLVVDYNRFDVDYLDYMALQAGVAVGLSLRSIDDK